MGLTQQEILSARKRLGIPEGGVETVNPVVETISRRRQMAAEYDAQNKPESTFGGDLKAIGEKRGEQFMQAADTKQGIISKGIQATGAVLGGAADVIGAGVKAGVRALPDAVEQPLKEMGTATVEAIAKTPILGGKTLGENIMNISQGLEQLKKEKPELGQNIEALLSIGNFAATVSGVESGLAGVEKGLAKAGQLAEKTLTKGGELVEKGVSTAQKVGSAAVKKMQAPPPTPLAATKQILQGETADIKSGVKALAQIDTAGVKTSVDLNKKMGEKITELAKKVDAELALDTTKKPLQDVMVNVPGKYGGNILKTSPIKTAITQLQELYDKTGDVSGVARMTELSQRALKEGLSDLEVNNIARLYGQEFGTKAFNKVGDPLTSVNAQMYENMRKDLKAIARQGLKGAEAKAADEAMSSLYDTQRLIKKNIEAVNKLQQKIQERGLFEKVGHIVSKYGNILSGGTIRGFIGGLLPRGAGYKVMNALDIEEALGKNLEILQKAIKSGNDEEIIKILTTLK